MDTVKIGKFIALLRHEKNMTQEQFGEQLGVTNKTVSRWETGTYIPPAEILLSMSQLFGVSVNELLSGERLTGEQYEKAAEENMLRLVEEVSTSGGNDFSLKERITFFRKKWLREHIALMAAVGAVILAVFVLGLVRGIPLLYAISLILLVIAHGWRYNAMMSYTELKAFDGSGKQ